MQLETYRNEICPFDAELLKNDEYTFFVLTRILKGVCTLTVTDHERIVVCYSVPPYPVWVWLADDATTEELDCAWKIVRENFLSKGVYRFNLKYSHAEYFLRRAKDDGLSLKVSLNLLAYNCPNPKLPKKKASGFCRAATMDDLETVTEMGCQFEKATGIDKMPREQHRELAAQYIQAGGQFLWDDGGIVAMCCYSIVDDKASINSVFTWEEKRRQGYAANLVYEVTERIKALGKMPLLYTDADYAASNACYTGIGYELRGNLCTVEGGI